VGRQEHILSVPRRYVPTPMSHLQKSQYTANIAQNVLNNVTCWHMTDDHVDQVYSIVQCDSMYITLVVCFVNYTPRGECGYIYIYIYIYRPIAAYNSFPCPRWTLGLILRLYNNNADNSLAVALWSLHSILSSIGLLDEWYGYSNISSFKQYSSYISCLCCVYIQHKQLIAYVVYIHCKDSPL